MTITMVATHSRVSCQRVTSAMSAIGGTTTTITKIIPVKQNGVHLVIEGIAQISQKLNDCWVQENSHHLLLFVVCVIDPSLARTVTLTICIVAVKTFHPSVTLTKNVLSVARPMRQNQEKEVTEGIEDPEIISAVGANAPFVKNKCTSPPIIVTSNQFQKRRMIPN